MIFCWFLKSGLDMLIIRMKVLAKNQQDNGCSKLPITSESMKYSSYAFLTKREEETINTLLSEISRLQNSLDSFLMSSCGLA